MPFYRESKPKMRKTLDNNNGCNNNNNRNGWRNNNNYGRNNNYNNNRNGWEIMDVTIIIIAMTGETIMEIAGETDLETNKTSATTEDK